MRNNLIGSSQLSIQILSYDQYVLNTEAINETVLQPVLRRPVLSQVVQKAKIKTGLVDDCSVKLGGVSWVQSGFRGRDAAVLLSSRQRGTTVNLDRTFASKK